MEFLKNVSTNRLLATLWWWQFCHDTCDKNISTNLLQTSMRISIKKKKLNKSHNTQNTKLITNWCDEFDSRCRCELFWWQHLNFISSCIGVKYNEHTNTLCKILKIDYLHSFFYVFLISYFVDLHSIYIRYFMFSCCLNLCCQFKKKKGKKKKTIENI